MTNLLTKLFPAHSRAARRTAAAPPRRPRPRLGVERLDDRLVPAVTVSLTNHVLTITDVGDRVDTVTVDQTPYFGSPRVNVTSTSSANSYINTVSLDQTNPAQQVSRIVFQGGTPSAVYNGVTLDSDTFRNNTTIDSDFYAGTIGGDLYGGGGTNNFYSSTNAYTGVTFYGGAGTNVFHEAQNDLSTFDAGTGPNILYRSGTRLIWQSAIVTPPNLAPPNTLTPGPMLTVGLSSQAYFGVSPDQTGALTASLDPTGHLLTLNGPGGAGFVLKGDWQNTRTALPGKLYQNTFKTTGTVTLQSGSVIGDVRFSPGGQAVTVTTQPSVFNAPVGTFTGMTWAGGLPLSSISTNSFASALKNAGVGLTGNNLSWGIALGSDLTGTGGFAGAPLRSAIPYLYASIGSGDGSAASVNYGGLSASVGQGAGIRVALDPADPCLYIQAATGTAAGTWAAAYSVKGDIPYVPNMAVPGFDPTSIQGNLYVSASGISLGDIPASLSGSVVIDLDANDDGKLANLGGQDLAHALHNTGSTLSGVLGDVRLGANGQIDLGYKMGGVNLTIPAGAASLAYAPGRVGFHGGNSNPFAGTPLAAFAPQTGAIDIQGSINWGSAGWGFNLTGTETNQSTGGLFGAQMTYTIDNTGIKATSQYTMDLTVATGTAYTSWSLQYQGGAFTLAGHVHADFLSGVTGFNVHGSLDVDLTVSTDFHGVQVSGHGHAGGGVTVAGVNADLNVNFGVDNNGFRIDLPLTDKDLVVKW